jgi:hypothetical protein
MPGLPVQFSYTSGNHPEQIELTDVNGYASITSTSTDSISILSNLDAITFTPIAGSSAYLSNQSPILIEAERSVTVIGMCRLFSEDNQDNILISLFNSSDNPLQIPTSQYLNTLTRTDGVLPQPSPPVDFSLGMNTYSLPVKELFNARGTCTNSTFVFLGKNYPISCEESVNDLNINLCSGEGLLSCSTVKNNHIRKILRRAVRGFYIGSRSAADLRRRFPNLNKSFSIQREATRALYKINKIIATDYSITKSCSPEKSTCFLTPFPKKDLISIFRKGFRPRPATGRTGFRAMIDRMELRFKEALRPLPSRVVACSD